MIRRAQHSRTNLRLASSVFLLAFAAACSNNQGSNDEVVNPGGESDAPNVGSDASQAELEDAALRNELTETLSEQPGNLAAREQLAELDQRSLENFGLLHRVDVDEHSILFLEPAPGVLSVIERGPIDLKPLTADLETNDAVEIFETLFPEKEVPQALLEAKERSLTLESAPAVQQAGEPTVALDDAPALEEQHATSSGTHFRNDHGGCPTFGAFDFCWISRTGDWSEVRNNVNNARMVVGNFHTSNIFTFTISVTGASSSQTILKGEIWIFTGSYPGTATGTIRGDLVGATKFFSAWHFGGTFAN